MNKGILAVYDSEENYVFHLMEFLSEKDSVHFEIHVFTQKEKFYSFAEKKDIECLLISESVYQKEVEMLNIPHIIILSESKSNLNNAFCHIYKYQSCDNIFHELMKYYSETTQGTREVLRTGHQKLYIIGIYTPVGRCLQTTFSLTLGQMLARRFKTLYLNFENYSGFGRMLNKSFSNDITDLMYFFDCTKEKLIYRMESMIENVNGLDFIPPAEIFTNLAGIRGEHWIELFREIEKTTEYNYLILDLADSIMDLWEVLRACDSVYTISREDGMALAKIEQYEKILTSMNYEDVTMKTVKWKLPVFKRLPASLEELTYGELAGFIKAEVYKDLFRASG